MISDDFKSLNQCFIYYDEKIGDWYIGASTEVNNNGIDQDKNAGVYVSLKNTN